jgi:uncharacterized protein (TIGR03435 family)
VYLGRTQLATVFALCASGAMFGQTAAQPLSFEVASIKASEPVTPQLIASGKIHAGMKMDNKRVDIGQMSLLALICKAYDVKTYQVTGPAWMIQQTMATPRFDIVANLPEGATKEQVPQMLQSLLKDRFKVEMHKESKDQQVYAMVLGKGGLKMKPADKPVDAEGNPAVSGSNSVSIEQGKGSMSVSDGTGKTQKMVPSADGKSMRLEMSGFTLAELAEGLTPLVDHPVVDFTGVEGKFQANLEISMADLMEVARKQGANVPPPAAGDTASDPTGSIFTSVQALGLKLEPRKAPMTFLVIDKAEKAPTEN